MTEVKGRGIGWVDAWRGVRRAWATTPNLRIEAAAFLVATAIAWWSEVSLVPIVLVSAVVIVAEVINTSIERVVDLVSPDRHDGAGAAKDVAAGAVLVAAAFAVAVGLLHLGPAILKRLS